MLVRSIYLALHLYPTASTLSCFANSARSSRAGNRSLCYWFFVCSLSFRNVRSRVRQAESSEESSNCRQNRSPKFFLAQLITMDLFFKNIFLSLALRYLFDRYLLPSSQYAEHTSSERFERFERFPNGALIVSNCDHINDQLIDRLFTSSNSAAVWKVANTELPLWELRALLRSELHSELHSDFTLNFRRWRYFQERFIIASFCSHSSARSLLGAVSDCVKFTVWTFMLKNF